MSVQFEWDQQKRKRNLQKHGIDFADCFLVFEGDVLTMEDTGFDYDEPRFVTVGLLRSRVVVVAHTESKCRIRVISMRKATRNEQEAYFKSLAH